MNRDEKVTAICIFVLMVWAVISVSIRAVNAQGGTGEQERAQNASETVITDEAGILARLMWEECRGVEGDTQKAAVAWCVLNRIDHGGYPDTVYGVVTQEGQFAWNPGAPVTEELLTLAQDVLLRWELEKLGQGDVGRVLPKEYIYFAGDGEENRFRAVFRGSAYHWDWAWDSPYEEEE